MIEQLAQELAGLSVSRIRQVVAKYNRHLKISGHSGLSKEALIGHILQKSNLDRPLMSKLLKETTFHKASSRSRKEPQIDLYSYIGERLKKEGFPKPQAPAPAPVQGPRNLQRGFGIQRFETPDPVADTEPESAPEPTRRPEPTPVVAEDAVISVAPRAKSTIEQATGLTREQFNALDPAEAFGRFLPVMAKRNLLGLKVASEDPETGKLVSKKTSKFTPVGNRITIDISKLFKFPKSRKSAKDLAIMIMNPTKEEIKNVKYTKFTYDTDVIFEDKAFGERRVRMNIPEIHRTVKELTEALVEYKKTGNLDDYLFYDISYSILKLSAEAGFGYKLDPDKAIEELHRLFPESRNLDIEVDDGFMGLGRSVYGMEYSIGLKEREPYDRFTYYIIKAMPFGFPSIAKKILYDKSSKTSTFIKTLLTKKDMWGQMKKGYTGPSIDYGA
tara:strand:- start:282 stop:1613 length:1332 start_codon:yes stop_codon:yes gene_type:complete